KEPVSLHARLSEDGDGEFGDLIEDTDSPAARRPLVVLRAGL
ncbi:sigma-70 domain-containing protein, partial [Streptomyces sp. NPDC005921]